MSTAPPELHQRPASAAAAPGERPVFADATDRRRLALRALGVGAAALAAGWLIALTLGVLGFDALPGVTLPGESRQADGPAPSATAGARRSDSAARRPPQPVVRSPPVLGPAAPAHAIAKRESGRSRGRRAGSPRRNSGGTSSDDAAP